MIQFRTTTLPSGLRVAICPQPALHRAHVALYLRVGSRFEVPKTNGISHFLEHMIYRGTPRLPSAHAVNYAFERLGGYLYAATHVDFGVFSVSLPPESLDEACALFGEVLGAPSFRDIEVEKGIVCEEILEDLDDEGRQVDADNLSRALIYPSHPLGFTITGDEARVRSFDDAMLRAHYARHYTASNAVLVFSGNVTDDLAMKIASRDFASLPRGDLTPFESPVHAQKKPRLEYVENASSQTELRVSLRAFGERDPSRYAIDMLMRIVDDGMSTRLYHRISDDKGLCYDVSAGYDGYDDDGIVDFAAGVQHERASEVTGEILGLLEDLAANGPTDDELAKAKQRHAWELRGMLDSAEESAGFIGSAWLFDALETAEERVRALDRVTKDDVREVVRGIARPERLNVVAVGLLEPRDEEKLGSVVKNWPGAR